jgi:hypothetical protein
MKKRIKPGFMFFPVEKPIPLTGQALKICKPLIILLIKGTEGYAFFL